MRGHASRTEMTRETGKGDERGEIGESVPGV